LVLISVAMSVGNGIDVIGDLARLNESSLLSTIAGGMLSGVFAVLLQRLATAALGVVTRGRLQELTDVDHPLLRKMARDAPGSWQHARAMANLAEGAAAAIGADALLTRVGAYYHDLGKTIQPKYFIENLSPGEPTPHADLEPDVSADAIMAHVVEGVRILRDGGIPEPVVEFAYTHHGTSVIEYFWHKCLEDGNPKGLSDAAFRYPGMRPRTKETAILMLIDAIEAAARTVDEPSREKFEAVVQRVTNIKLRQGQLDVCGLTMEDIRVLQSTLIDTLCNAYHNRIKYPWQDKEGEGETPLPVPGVATEKDVARERSREST
jgi:putative nucleotidyltransferase with HDIG domain